LAHNRISPPTNLDPPPARQQRQKEKAEKRVQRRAEKETRPTRELGVDPDIAGIQPGPQPHPAEDE
jgi:hypothetical protein